MRIRTESPSLTGSKPEPPCPDSRRGSVPVMDGVAGSSSSYNEVKVKGSVVAKNSPRHSPPSA